MFKVLPPKAVIMIIAWATIGFAWVWITFAEVALWFSYPIGIVVSAVWFFFIFIMAKPVWRWAWRKLPRLNEWVYPDLNGEWDVAIESNWPRIEALFRAAKGETESITGWSEGNADLSPLGLYTMRARISQSWLRMSIHLWDPTGKMPIRDSKTLLVHPFRGEEGCHGLAYIFDQTNDTDELNDDSRFQGGAYLKRDRDDLDVLRGRMWTDRMWRRGMNTVATVTFTRRQP